MDWEIVIKQVTRVDKQCAALWAQLADADEEAKEAADKLYAEVYEARCAMTRAIGLARVAALAAQKASRDDE